MSIFLVDVDNEFGADQPFILEAADFVDATMQALDFMRELDLRVKERFSDLNDMPPSKIRLIQDTSAFWANEEGMRKYLETIDMRQEQEDEED